MQYKDVVPYWRGDDTLAYTAKSVPCFRFPYLPF